MVTELPSRKKIRLKDYDYSQSGAYFITFCVKDRHEMLGKIVGRGILDAPCVQLSECGRRVAEAIEFLNNANKKMTIEKYVITPNHVHMIVLVFKGDGASEKPRPTNAVIPKIISSIKRFTNRQMGFSIWQKSFYDHIIRDEDDYRRVWQYIDENPARWDEDEYHL